MYILMSFDIPVVTCVTTNRIKIWNVSCISKSSLVPCLCQSSLPLAQATSNPVLIFRDEVDRLRVLYEQSCSVCSVCLLWLSTAFSLCYSVYQWSIPFVLLNSLPLCGRIGFSVHLQWAYHRQTLEILQVLFQITTIK